MTTIRFINDLNENTDFNMAADQYLLGRCVQENILYIRFYSWKTPSITIGYMQDPQETLLIDNLKKNGVNWIRRPTGGRAVFHCSDLTYSCIFPKTFSFMGSTVKESYAVITKCLIEGLSYAGIKCETHDSYDQLLSVKRQTKLPCFLAPNRDEIMINGKKFVGSAQKRTLNAVLQHGSLPITDDFCNLPAYLNINEEEQHKQNLLLHQKCVCLQEIAPQISVCNLIDFLKKGFLKSLQLEYCEDNWCEEELREINKLAMSKEFIKTWKS